MSYKKHDTAPHALVYQINPRMCGHCRCEIETPICSISAYPEELLNGGSTVLYQVYLCDDCEHSPGSISSGSDEQIPRIWDFVHEELRKNGPASTTFGRVRLPDEKEPDVYKAEYSPRQGSLEPVEIDVWMLNVD